MRYSEITEATGLRIDGVGRKRPARIALPIVTPPEPWNGKGFFQSAEFIASEANPIQGALAWTPAMIWNIAVRLVADKAKVTLPDAAMWLQSVSGRDLIWNLWDDTPDQLSADPEHALANVLSRDTDENFRQSVAFRVLQRSR